jgi:DMSO reductase anchor subunit
VTLVGRSEPGGFHELPLVLFAALISAGGGVGSAQLIYGLMGWTSWVPTREVSFIVATLLLMGLLSSLGHLGRPTRGHRALHRVGRSRLSNEVAVVGLATVAALSAVLLPGETILGVGSGLVYVVLAPAILLAVGFVYRMPGQITWIGLAPFHPLMLGLGLGLIVLLGWLPEGAQARGEFLILSVLMLDGVFVWDRARRILEASGEGIPVHPRLMDQRTSALTLRVLLGILLPAVALLSGWRELAALSLFVNLFLDRFLFYGLAVRVNTEAAVRKAESALKAAASSSRDSR